MVSVVIVSAGSFTRMDGINKQLAEICGIPVVVHSALAFEQVAEVDEIVIAAREDDTGEIRRLCGKFGVKKLKAVVSGGADRRLSVLAGLRAVGTGEYIAIHDGARPNITPELITEVINDAKTYGAAILAVPVKDTVKVVKNGIITETPARDSLYAAQTPQVFRKEIYTKALESYAGNNLTDDAMLVEAAGYEVKITNGSYDNIKITTASDLATVESIINAKGSTSKHSLIGHGYDVHRLAEGRNLILGGVKIPHDRGLLGHSDADVLVHAVIDAILGATAQGDIGQLFPDTDEKYKGANSLELLAHVIELIVKKGYSIINIDTIIIAEQPKIAPYIPQMRENIAKICKMPITRISVKATTEEGLGIADKGIGAHAVCMAGEE